MLLWVALGQRLPPGHEQSGERPAVLAGVPARLKNSRFPTLVVIPITSARDQPWSQASPNLYPLLAAGSANLPRASILLLDQVQSIDAKRVLRVIGSLTESDYARVRRGLAGLFELS